jgi:hypothetical protein
VGIRLDVAMTVAHGLKRCWERRFPGLSGKWTHCKITGRVTVDESGALEEEDLDIFQISNLLIDDELISYWRRWGDA